MRETQYKGFTVKDDGTVINRFGKQVGFTNKHGYRYIQIGSKRIGEHRFVWEAFNGEIPEGMEIDHINTNRADNRLENLRLVTISENRRNPLTIEHYKQSNKGKWKGTLMQRFKNSATMWMANTIRRYHKNGNKYIYQD